MRYVVFRIALVTCLTTTIAFAQQSQDRNYPPSLDGAHVEVYKTIDDVKLNIYIFTPEGHRATDRRPAAVFFFGGGWRGGTPKQFEQHCKHLASRGMLAMAADYRVSSRHNTKAVSCVEDAKSAVRWIRKEAERLGVDPNRILAAGGSAGGHIAACTGTIDKFDRPSEELSISSKPDAMALFNPATVLAEVDGQQPFGPDRLADLEERMGVDPEELSPYHHVQEGVPPTIIFHGKADTTVEFWTAEAFADAMTKAGNRCVLYGFTDQPHGFFNYGRSDNKYYDVTLKALDKFLDSLDYLPSR